MGLWTLNGAREKLGYEIKGPRVTWQWMDNIHFAPLENQWEPLLMCIYVGESSETRELSQGSQEGQRPAYSAWVKI